MISKHISIEEATGSPTALRLGIKNEPNETVLDAMKHVAENLFEPIREWYGKPIKVNSFYRCPELNKAVNGSKTSGHVLGNSIDISGGSKAENKKIFDYICKNLDFDQVILEFGGVWVHISLKKEKNRKQVLHIG
jgi:hypothetical protein